MAKQKVVIKVSMADAKKRVKVLRIVVGFHGVSSISEENGEITFVGDGIDPVKITACIRKKTCSFAQLLTVEPVKDKEEKPPPWYYCYETYPCHF